MAFFPKQPSWRSEIIGLSVNDEHHFPYDDRNYIYTLISGSIKQKHPDQAYETNITEILVEDKEVQVIGVKRIA